MDLNRNNVYWLWLDFYLFCINNPELLVVSNNRNLIDPIQDHSEDSE